MKHEHRKTPWFDWRFTLCYLGLLAIIVLLNMLTLLHRLDSYVQSAQYQIAEIENYHNAVIVKLDRDSERMLQTVVPSFSQKPEAWRPLHAQLINKLIAAKVRVIVFDLFFNRVEAALDHEFQSALAHAQEESIAVVLSFSEELPAHPFYRAAYKGLSRGLAEEGSEVVKKLLLFDEFENGRGQAYPSLVAQAWSLWRSHPFMLEAQVHDGVLYCAQTRPIQQKKFWLLYAREEFEEYGYATILQWTPGREDTSLKGKAVFIGTALERDSHQVLGDQRKRHGVYLHAHAFNQLNAGAFVREISLEGKFLICLLLGVVFALYARLFQRLKRAQWLALAFVTLAFVLFGFLLSGILTPFATLSFAGITAILLMLKRKEATMKPVFIVHGRDETLLQTTARLVTQLGLDPIILREQTSEGRTVIEKFEKHAQVSFAIVLLTPDDVGCLASEHPAQLKSRARQNVILELGFFLGKLGRARVCALLKPGVELPSDYLGMVFIDVDGGGAWQYKLAKEMKTAGLPVDLNRVPMS